MRYVATRESPALVRNFVGHSRPVLACAVTADSRRVVSAAVMWIPPHALHSNVCTPQDAAAIVSCFVQGQSCDVPVSAACHACAVSGDTTPYSSALIVHDPSSGKAPELNIAGCVGAASGDPSLAGCGAKLAAKMRASRRRAPVAPTRTASRPARRKRAPPCAPRRTPVLSARRCTLPSAFRGRPSSRSRSTSSSCSAAPDRKKAQ